MTRPPGSTLLTWLASQEAETVALLDRLVVAESPSTDAGAQEGPFGILAAELARLDYAVRHIRGWDAGDHLYARPPRRRRHVPVQLVVGHMDTVWPVGTLLQMPLRHEGDVVFGPGTYDMKAGLVALVAALRALRAFDLSPAVTPVVFVNSDEEVGSRSSQRLLLPLARAAARAFVLEGAEGREGRLKIARKGIGDFTITVHGRASHAGTSFEQGASAILELSHQVQRLFAMNDPRRGITVNVGMIDGGLRPNVVAPEASAVVSVRIPTEASGGEVEQAIRGLRPVLPGTVIEVTGGIDCPPMEATPRNRQLLATAQRLGREIGLDLEDAGLAGGTSDANLISLHTATLDGLGPSGDGDHSVDEHVSIGSIEERAALLALLLLEPLQESFAENASTSLATSRGRASIVRCPAPAIS
jgi:glutamate carboxypeptidase